MISMLHLWRIAIGVGALLGCSDKQSALTADEATMMKFKERSCACRDRTCADQVAAEAIAWSDARTATVTPRMKEILSALIRCQYDASRTTPVASPPAMPSGNPDLEVLVQSARDHAKQVAPNLVISEIAAQGVRSDGTLAPEGRLRIDLRPASDEQSPGADACPKWIARGGAWHVERGSCTPLEGLAPQLCTFRGVWDKALRDRDPPSKTTLAEIRLIADPDRQGARLWTFAIKPDAVARSSYPDDCR